MKLVAHAVSVSAAVIAKPQPWGDSLQAAWKTTTAKETFGHNRNSILHGVRFFPLCFVLKIPSSALFFHYLWQIFTFPPQIPSLACSFFLLFLKPPSSFLPSFLNFTSSCHTFSPPLPSCLLLYASQAPAPHYVSLPGQCCQQLEHITANCATCGPLKGRKRG